MHDSSEETALADSEGADGPDKPPHGKTSLSNHLKAALNIHAKPHPTEQLSSKSTVPLPPPEAGTYDKQPGHTRGTLQKLSALSSTSVDKKGSKASSASSPTASESDWGVNSAPSTRPPSRAPSMSAGTSGGKVVIPTPQKNGKAVSPPASDSTPSASTITPNQVRPAKPASVHSDSGASHKFTLKDLLAAGPKLPRKSSQRSVGSRSSKRSDSDAGSDGGKGGKAKSTAGDSTLSLAKKYGVCQKVAIGKGATSVVRLAHKWDRSEEKLYAVKEFRKRRKNESEKEYVKKLTAEFCISSTLHHPNIVETVDLVQDENQHWCEVMEFCPGGDLYAAIKKGGMSPSEVECCFKQILKGVEYLHSQGVAHRDIKPENLFFDTKGHLKIGDYGASTVYRLPWEATIHMSTGLCGSEPYIAPEQFLGKHVLLRVCYITFPHPFTIPATLPFFILKMHGIGGPWIAYDARLVDIWACGIVYYCLHFQELPWRAAQPATDNLYSAYATACASTTPAISACPPTINNLSPRACRSLIRKMLEPDPRQRSTIEEVVAHAWIKGIDVCYEAPTPQHVHVNASLVAAAHTSGHAS
ncbi:kinase-like domain-containing protein [Collybia nuda]|uniref:non-specific serine/threonine protein kinase n=1 Tax=Collybia nuda TaxID=64659 RepID=A0A9P5YE13_9AGAR|nr:kinase-like domain-containing protein [Collybia nuda]